MFTRNCLYPQLFPGATGGGRWGTDASRAKGSVCHLECDVTAHPLQFWDQVSMKKQKCLVATESDRARHETKPTVQRPHAQQVQSVLNV